MSGPSLPASMSLLDGPFAERLVAEVKAMTEFNPGRFEMRQSKDDVKTDLEMTCTDCDTVICDVEADDELLTLLNMAQDHSCQTGTCIHCGRDIAYNGERWIDPEAPNDADEKGNPIDDAIWRESCDSNDHEINAPHEPEEA